jgi:enoyl-CoA hydratase/carnithine racemase
LSPAGARRKPDQKDQALLVSTDGPVSVLRLNRPHVRNAIDDALREDMLRALEIVGADESIRVVVITGAGSAFSAGGDISAMRERLAIPPGQTAAKGWRRIRRAERLVNSLHECDKITIAAVNGPAFGFGMDLALCCDFLIASTAAVFSMSYVLRGLIPDGGGMYFLPRRVGLAHAKDLIFSGRRVDASEALALGIADRVVGAEELDDAAGAWGQELAKSPPTAVSLAKSILNRSFELDLKGVLALGAEAMALCYTTDEHRDSVADFLEQARKPPR